MTRAASFVCHQMKSTDGHMDTNTELSGNCEYFLAQKKIGRNEKSAGTLSERRKTRDFSVSVQMN